MAKTILTNALLSHLVLYLSMTQTQRDAEDLKALWTLDSNSADDDEKDDSEMASIKWNSTDPIEQKKASDWIQKHESAAKKISSCFFIQKKIAQCVQLCPMLHDEPLLKLVQDCGNCIQKLECYEFETVLKLYLKSHYINEFSTLIFKKIQAKLTQVSEAAMAVPDLA
jgi:hypothetical protein